MSTNPECKERILHFVAGGSDENAFLHEPPSGGVDRALAKVCEYMKGRVAAHGLDHLAVGEVEASPLTFVIKIVTVHQPPECK